VYSELQGDKKYGVSQSSTQETEKLSNNYKNHAKGHSYIFDDLACGQYYTTTTTCMLSTRGRE